MPARVEALDDAAGLPRGDGAQGCGAEAEAFPVPEHGLGAVDRRGVERRPGEARAPGAVGDAAVLRAGQRAEVGEPAGVDRAQRRAGGDAQPADPVAEAGVLVPARGHVEVLARGAPRQGHHVEGVVRVDEDHRPDRDGLRQDLAEPGHHVGVLEEHRRERHHRGAGDDRGEQGVDELRSRARGDPLHLGALLGEAGELAAQGVELALGGDDARPLLEREAREQAVHQLVRALAEGDGVPAGEAEALEDPLADGAGAGEDGRLPLVVDEAGRVVERLRQRVARHVRPGLVRVAGEQDPTVHQEARVRGPQEGEIRDPVGRGLHG